MVNAEELAGEVRARIATHFEWLLVRSEGRTFPLRRSEIDVTFDGENSILTILDDSGLGSSRILSFDDTQDGETLLEIVRPSGASAEIIRKPHRRTQQQAFESAGGVAGRVAE